LLAVMDSNDIDLGWLQRVVPTWDVPTPLMRLDMSHPVQFVISDATPSEWAEPLISTSGKLRTSLDKLAAEGTDLKFSSELVHVIGTLVPGSQPDLRFFPDLSFDTLVRALIRSHVTLVALTLFEPTPTNRPVPFAEAAIKLVEAGVSIVVANHRQVSTTAVALFFRNLYQSLLNRDSLAEALLKSRRACAAREQNWAAFGVFSNVNSFDDVRAGNA
jgi:hypothetical protein